MLAPEWQPGRADDPGNGSVWTCLAQAAWAVRHHATFHDAVVAAIDLGDDTDTVACVTGALAGARCGIQAIPSRWTTYVHGRVRTSTGWDRYDNAGLQALALRLIGVEGSDEAPAEVQMRPTEILEGVWGCDFAGAAQYGANGDFDVLSLCRVVEAFKDVEVRREVYMVDKAGDRNPALRKALVDAVDTIDAWRAEGRKVLVHCHGGRSRTTLVVKAWAMRHQGLTAERAHEWMGEVWDRYDSWNPTFLELLASDWDH
jgi:ADP-ribosyl-[dinitrogen reductase] hydrolase